MTDEERKQAFLGIYRGGDTSGDALEAAEMSRADLDALRENDPEFAVAFEQANQYRAERMKQELRDALPQVVRTVIAEALAGKITAGRMILDFMRQTSGGKDLFRRPNKGPNGPAEWPVDEAAQAAFDAEIADIAKDIR